MTTQQETGERRRLERARESALFRYPLVQEVIGLQLTAAQRGQMPPASARGPPGAEAHAMLVLARAAGEADATGLPLERAAACADQPPVVALDAARCRRGYWLAADLLTTAASRLFITAGTRATSAAAPKGPDRHVAADHD